MKTSVLFLIVLAIASCSKDDVIESAVEPTPLIEIEFSTPPIDLEDVDAKFVTDIAYYEHNETKFDIFLPDTSSPTGLVIFIHGGGFKNGDKSFVYENSYPISIRQILKENIAVATINYRLLGEAETEGVLKCLNDSKRAIQYIRYIHKELNIDKDNIVLYGGSAGSGTSLWIATNDDLKEEGSSDPVLRESTRVKGIAISGTQASYDFENRWVNDVFIDFEISWETFNAQDEEGLFQFYGIFSWEEYETTAIDEYRQKVDMLSLLSSDDPEIWASSGGPNGFPVTSGDLNHHPFHVREIKEYADAAGIKTNCKYGKPTLYIDEGMESYPEFLIRKVKE